MVIAVYMGDHTLFDNLWKYEQLHLDPNGLMNWSIDSSGNTTGSGTMTVGGGARHRRRRGHGLGAGDGRQAVGVERRPQLAEPGQDADPGHLEPRGLQLEAGRSGRQLGAGATCSTTSTSRTSRRPTTGVFKQVDTDWTPRLGRRHPDGLRHDLLRQVGHDVLQRAQHEQQEHHQRARPGLVHEHRAASSSAGPYNYQYDACRTPFRIGIDWCLNGASASSAAAAINPSRAQAYVGVDQQLLQRRRRGQHRRRLQHGRHGDLGGQPGVARDSRPRSSARPASAP